MSYDRPGLVVYQQPPGTSGAPPRKYTKDLHQKIVALLRAGMSPDNSARACGISPPTFWKWVMEGREGNQWLADFASEVDQAIGTSHLRMEQVIVDAAREDPELALKVLERRDPKQWNKQTNLQVGQEFERFMEECERQLPAKYYAQIVAIAMGTSGAAALPAAEPEEDD